MASISQRRLRNRIRRQNPGQRKRHGQLGDGNGNVYVPGTNRGRVYARFRQPDGTLGVPRKYRYKDTLKQFVSGLEVTITYEDGLAYVIPTDAETRALYGVSPASIDEGTTATTTQSLFKLLPFQSFAFTTDSTDSTIIAARGGIVLRNGVLQKYQDANIDASGEATSAGQHKLICVAFKTDGTLELGTSTAQATSVDLDLTDEQEALDDLSVGSVPSAFWVATENTGTVVRPGQYPNGDLWRDARQVVNAQDSGTKYIQYDESNTSNPPTDAELDSAFGTPATVGEGFVVLLDDNGGDSNVYLVASNGTSWWYTALTKAT